MKKAKIAIAVMSAIFISQYSHISAEAKEYCGTLKYIIQNDKAVITGFSGEPEILEIPAYIDGREVSQIRENAFYKCDSLKKVSIPQTVMFIGHHAFYECVSLEVAELPDSIYSIDEGCFYGCSLLSNVNFPQDLRIIEESSFYNCRSLEKVEFPSCLEEIGDYAFSGCQGVSDISLNNKLLKIGNYSFSNCGMLEKVYIPESVTEVGSCAFGYEENPIKAVSDFVVSGEESSIGMEYARSNGFRFENTDKRKVNKKVPAIPALGVVFSGAGLLFFKFLEKSKLFKRKYEYEY